MSGTGAASGWYPDPYLPSQWRYFDGNAWTAYTYAAVGASVQPGTTLVAPHPVASTPSREHSADRAVAWLIPVGRTGLSIAAGYAGIVALLCFYAGPVALVLGILALRGLRGSPLRGKGRAWFAVVVGVIGTGLLAAFALGSLLHVPGWS